MIGYAGPATAVQGSQRAPDTVSPITGAGFVQTSSARPYPMPGSRFAPIDGGEVSCAFRAHPGSRVAEVVESEVSTSR